MLRHLGRVISECRGRNIVCARHDPHVADLLDQAAYDIEHLGLGYPDQIEEAS